MQLRRLQQLLEVCFGRVSRLNRRAQNSSARCCVLLQLVIKNRIAHLRAALAQCVLTNYSVTHDDVCDCHVCWHESCYRVISVTTLGPLQTAGDDGGMRGHRPQAVTCDHTHATLSQIRKRMAAGRGGGWWRMWRGGGGGGGHRRSQRLIGLSGNELSGRGGAAPAAGAALTMTMQRWVPRPAVTGVEEGCSGVCLTSWCIVCGGCMWCTVCGTTRLRGSAGLKWGYDPLYSCALVIPRQWPAT